MPRVSERKRRSASPLDAAVPAKKRKRKSQSKALRNIKDNSASEESSIGDIAADSDALQDSAEQRVDTDALGDSAEAFVPLQSDVMLAYLYLPPVTPITEGSKALPQKLTPAEVKELATALELDKNGETWCFDWCGNLAYMDRAISNPKATNKHKSFNQSLFQWAHKAAGNTRLLYNLLRHVYSMDDTPPTAKAILAAANPTSVQSIAIAMRRLTYDPEVLREDGWTTTRALEPQGATGGAYLIGAKIRWQDSDAVVIAFVHDPDIGDLWKAFWLTEQLCFDLEAEELLEAKKKWERRNNITTTDAGNSRNKGTRFSIKSDFSVPGIQYGIVLAASFDRGARSGVFWPARVMHASENTGFAVQNKRSSARQKVDVVFLAPFWNSDQHQQVVRGKASLSESSPWTFHSGPLFQFENIEATEEMIREYTFGKDGKIDLDELRMSFRFTGLPKHAFSRFLDAHRLACGLRHYAEKFLKSEISDTNTATAALFETHVMSVQAPLFPTVALHLPFEYMLEQLRLVGENSNGLAYQGNQEPVLQLNTVIEAMNPPHCWGLGLDALGKVETPNGSTPPAVNNQDDRVVVAIVSADEKNGSVNGHHKLFESVIADLPVLKGWVNHPSATSFKALITQLLKPFANYDTEAGDADYATEREAMLRSWVIMKRIGMEILASDKDNNSNDRCAEWAIAAERIYRSIVGHYSSSAQGKGVTLVLSDYRCNGHKTSNGCFERAVRLPAAIKGAKLAGAGHSESIQLITEVSDDAIKRAERVVLPMAHARAYLDRMKKRCAMAKSADESLILTDDSNGKGGEDTRGSKGTWDAAVAAVAVALNGVDKIVNGECVNAFCVTRPPGHHAGRTLHSMKAVSNGFCVLNTVACAALYAVTPLSEGGHGLSKVCVIDFDVHHGNGTQDILCSTYDPRFLYVSVHAGGPHVNGVVMEDDPKHELHDLAGRTVSGIYPGRCGDTSPHEGVLNIPLGSMVTAQEVGMALVSRVTPRVSAFSPDLILLSAGFDAHKSDPMGLGSLSAADFGHVTEVACQLAFKSCSGRVLSVLEGGYGVPCCRPQICELISPPDPGVKSDPETANGTTEVRPQPSKLLDLGDDLPVDMDDQVPLGLQRRLEKCHSQGFVECVCEHVRSLARCNNAG